jgi:hypothetical protein
MPESTSHDDVPAKFIGKHGSQPKPRLGVVAPLALVVALVGAGLAGLALYRSERETPSPAAAGPAVGIGQPDATEQQPGAARAQLCEAFATVKNAVTIQTHANLGPDPVALQAVAANARLAMIGGADYLQRRIDPAAPADLVGAVRSFTNDLQDIGVNALAGVGNDDAAQAARLKAAQTASDQIAELCK